MLSFSLAFYVICIIYDTYIPIIAQGVLIVFLIILPLLFTYLQYNNIIFGRKLLYYKMKWQLFNRNYDETVNYVNKLIEVEGGNSNYFRILGECYKSKKIL